MPRSKLRQALGAVKDQTSLGLAKVSNNATTLDVAILKATTHDECPIDDRYIKEILQLVSSSQSHAAGCVQSIAKRIGKTRNWVVVLKSLTLVLKIFQHGDPYFPCEVFHAMKQGAKILNLSGFRDDKSSSPWDYTAFVRAFALYLDERLDCVLTGKLHKEKRKSRRVRDMKPAMLLDMILHWQKLIDKIIATTPSSVVRSNKFIQICLYSVVQESFDLYKDVSDALALLLDSFFQLQHQSCVTAFQTCVRASKQFEQLGAFYMICKSIGVGRSSEYPSVQKISNELIETLQEFLKDQSSFPIANGSNKAPSQSVDGALLLLPAPLLKGRTFSEEFSETTENSSEKDFDVGSTVSSRHQSLGSMTNFDNFDVAQQKLHMQELEIPRKSDMLPILLKQLTLSEEFSETTKNSSEKDSDVGSTASSRNQSLGSMTNFDNFDVGQQNLHVQESELSRKSDMMPVLLKQLSFSKEFSEISKNSSEKDSDVGIDISSQHQSSSSTTNFDFFDMALKKSHMQESEIQIESEMLRMSVPVKQCTFSEELSETTDNSSEKGYDVVSGRHQSSSSITELEVPRKRGFGSWELLVLGEIENKPTAQVEATSERHHHHFNPFLQDLTELTAADNGCFSMGPTTEASTAPTFSAQNADEKDTFGSTNDGSWCMSQEKIVHEQQLWLEHQNKIIAKNMT